MMEEPLVSIITPCYNGEDYLHRFFCNILDQSYRNIELIFINDGSKDNTEEIALSYQQEFQNKKNSMIYVYQENAGQAAAVNKGLKLFHGEYILWTDSDDLLDIDNVKLKVEFLEKNPEYGFVMCYGKVVKESDLAKKVDILRRVPPKEKDNLFEDLILEHNVVYTPGVYMVRTKAFLDANPKREIYESRIGQNWQMLLPIAYTHKCGYLNKELFSYVIRDNSHSRDITKEEEMIKKYKFHEQELTKIVKGLEIDNKEYYLKLIKEKYIRMQLHIAHMYKNKRTGKYYYRKLKEITRITYKDIIYYLSIRFRLMDLIFQLIKATKKYIKMKMS